MPAVTPAPYALTSVEAFFRHLGENPSDGDGRLQDRAQQLINAYSKAANKFMKRQMKPVLDDADKVFSYSGNGLLSLAPFEARAITTVTLYTDRAEDAWLVLENQTPTQAARWRPNPRGKTEQGTYWSLTLPELGRFHPYLNVLPWPPTSWEFQVTVHGDWGVDQVDVPDDVELAIWIAVSNAWANPGGHQTRRLGPLATTDFSEYVPGTEEGLSLPRASRSLLSGYRRRTGGR